MQIKAYYFIKNAEGQYFSFYDYGIKDIIWCNDLRDANLFSNLNSASIVLEYRIKSNPEISAEIKKVIMIEE